MQNLLEEGCDTKCERDGNKRSNGPTPLATEKLVRRLIRRGISPPPALMVIGGRLVIGAVKLGRTWCLDIGAWEVDRDLRNAVILLFELHRQLCTSKERRTASWETRVITSIRNSLGGKHLSFANEY
jgi:hypothetical protein